MGRTPLNPVSTLFFEYNKRSNTSKCTISDCPHLIMKGQHSMILEKHVEHRHQKSCLELLKEKKRIEHSDSDSDEVYGFDSSNKKLKVKSTILFLAN